MVIEQNEKVEEIQEKKTVANVEVYGAEVESVFYEKKLICFCRFYFEIFLVINIFVHNVADN